MSLAGLAAFSLSTASLRADAAGQAADLAALQGIAPGKSLINATARQLAQAVAVAITTNTNAQITPADLAAGALEPVTVTVKGKPEIEVRADRNTSAPLVAGSAVNALLSGSDPALAADVAAITDSVAVVNGTDARENLGVGSQSAVVKAALGAVSDAAASDDSLLAADQAIGQALAGDPILEGLPDNALTAILQSAIAGINGASGRAQAVAPAAAGDFVAGVLSSGAPNGAALPAFAVAILRKVSKNTAVDEYVAYETGLRDTVPADLATLATALYASYPAAAVRVTQGITAAVPQGFNNEIGRSAFLQELTTAQPQRAVTVIQGAIFADPFYAAQFTQAVFSALLARTSGTALLRADAIAAAGAIGTTLGQDGGVLTRVAEVYGESIGSGALPAARAGAYAKALIGGAVRSAVPAFTGAAAGGGGGYLNVGPGIATETVTDLASIVDLLANGIVTAGHGALTGSGLANAASEVGALAGVVARFTKNEAFVDSAGISEPVAVFLAGTLAADIAALSLGAAPQAAILNAIGNEVRGITNGTIDPQVTAAIKAYQEFAVVGAVNTPETAVTNL